LKTPLCALLALAILTSCSEVDPTDEARIIEDLPNFQFLADSLNTTSAMSAKWSVNDGAVVYSKPQPVNWTLELEALRKTDVNHLRFRENYLVIDTMVGAERRVDFIAISEEQEVQKVSIRLVNNQITYYYAEKNESSIFSSSLLIFEFKPTSYSLTLNQSIPWLFESNQKVVGTIINAGSLWRGVITMGDKKTPIQFILDGEGQKMSLRNGPESIGFNQFSSIGDTLIFGSDYFPSNFRLRLLSDSTLEGYWINNKREVTRKLRLSAKKDVPYRFLAHEVPEHNVSGSHAAVFYDANGSAADTVILRLTQRAHAVSGSFLTETGDYRFLEGVVRNDSLLMSTMDGTHVYLFEAEITGQSLKGIFYSGPTYRQPWTAQLLSAPILRDPKTITALNDSVPFDFSFTDPEGAKVSLSDDRFKNKPILVSIMGTWCSNCLDEAVFLKEVYETYHDSGLEVVGLDFELVSDSSRAIENIKRHKAGLKIDYPILLACLSSSKQKAASILPSLSGVYSYPTLLVLDKNHEVVRVHTGFNGPATGVNTYDEFRMEYLTLIDALVKDI